MLARVKPVAIMAEDEISAEMQRDIANGHIIDIGSVEFQMKHRIYCQRSEVERAGQAAKILENAWFGGQGISYEENQILGAVLQQPPEGPAEVTESHVTAIFNSMSSLDAAIMNDKKGPEMEAMLEGRITALAPVRIDYEKRDEDLEKAVAEGDLSAVDFEGYIVVCLNNMTLQARQLLCFRAFLFVFFSCPPNVFSIGLRSGEYGGRGSR